MLPPTALPIDPLLPDIVASLQARPNLVLEAPPGAGKTTRVPRALLDAGFDQHGEIVVLEPRRLAARLAARRVAEELSGRVGDVVGYTVRFEDVSSRRTRVRFLTEGLLVRRLIADPKLTGVSTVVLDEFHERHLNTDLTLALLRRLQLGARPDLRLLVMSATLEASPIATFLDAPVLHAEGRRFDVSVEYLPRPDDRPVERQVLAAVQKLLAGGLDGDVLAFLPGAGEIRRARDACAAVGREADLLVLPLYGDLTPAEQDRAVSPADRRKLILSTNVAETSVTIEGISAVIDTGLARVAGHAPWSGLPTLRVVPISRASAAQRRGRAGRTRAGTCLRLYTQHDHDTRAAFDVPEIARSDLSEALLSLYASGVTEVASFGWFEPPEAAAVSTADALLRRLSAVDDAGTLTAVGRRMLEFPLHPRQARLVIEAERRGVAEAGCAIAALLGERPIELRTAAADRTTRRGAAAAAGSSDLLVELARFEAACDADFDPQTLFRAGIDASGAKRVSRARDQLLARCPRRSAPQQGADEEQSLLLAILAGYPNRVARRRTVAAHHARSTAGDLAFADGGTAELSQTSVVQVAPLLVAVDAEDRRGAPALVRRASAIEPEYLLELFPERIHEAVEVTFNEAAERVDAVTRLTYEGLVLEEARSAPPEDEAARVLARAALARGPAAFAEEGELDRFRARVAFVSTLDPQFTAVGEDDVRAALSALCEGRRALAELRGGALMAALGARFSPEERARLAALAPERVRLAAGRDVRVEYEAGKGPYAASRLQDFFGMRETPRIGRGQVALTLHLLAPNKRAVQVTSDLAGFWQRHYPQVRKELGRRYPRHAWPDDPLNPLPKSNKGS